MNMHLNPSTYRDFSIAQFVACTCVFPPGKSQSDPVDSHLGAFEDSLIDADPTRAETYCP
jgi:hypothetical protein